MVQSGLQQDCSRSRAQLDLLIAVLALKLVTAHCHPQTTRPVSWDLRALCHRKLTPF